VRIGVFSEIAPLNQVLVHRPGLEIERMTQHELERLLFDDILSPADARREHDLMVEIIRGAGAEVLYLEELLADALGEAPAKEVRALVDEVCTGAGAGELAEILADWPAGQLARGLIGGVHYADLEDAPISLARLRARIYDPSDFALKPQPNLMFMRDPCMSVFDRVVVGSMATAARSREPHLVEFAVNWGGDVQSAGFLDVSGIEVAPTLRSLEGGDLLVVNEKFLLVGCSERTRAQAIERFCEDELFAAFPDLERVYAVLMPEARSIMHLDTVLTQIDEQLFLGHRPLIAGGSDGPVAAVARLERRTDPVLLEKATVLDVLREELGDVKLVSCGGDDPTTQEREQWTDGANAFALAPGRILLYSRNVATVDALQDYGFEPVLLDVALPEELRQARIAEGASKPRTVFCFSGSELSRARGGGRCLTMPLNRGLKGAE
jgi:arginine deiminase